MSNSVAQKYAVTQKVVLAQQQYIKDLETKLQAVPASNTQIQQLQRGISHFRSVAETNELENRRLQKDLNVARAELQASTTNNTNNNKNRSGNNAHLQQTRRLQTQHARELEASRSDLAQLEQVVERNQKLATTAHQVLEDERRHRERLIEEQVAERVNAILSSTEQSSRLEASQLRTEVQRLRSNIVETDDGKQSLRGELMNDVGRLRKQMGRQRHSHDNHVTKLRDQLIQTVRVMEEREIIIAEERQAFESELALSKSIAEEKECAFLQQIEDLNAHAEALTTTLAKQPLVYTDEDGNLAPEDEKSVQQIESEYEERLRAVLKMKEKSEARLLAERSQLLGNLHDEEKTRGKYLSEGERASHIWKAL